MIESFFKSPSSSRYHLSFSLCCGSLPVSGLLDLYFQLSLDALVKCLCHRVLLYYNLGLGSHFSHLFLRICHPCDHVIALICERIDLLDGELRWCQRGNSLLFCLYVF